MKKIIFATQNQGKIKEIRKILEDLPVEVLTMTEAGIDLDIEETGITFAENAKIKAEALREYTDALILADDSGLEIDYLNKEPGVYSARYLGKDTPYEEKNQIILDRLKDVPQAQRTARFVCAIAAAGVGIETKVVTCAMEGFIGQEAKGVNGFGYDPIFCANGYEISTAELSIAEKNKISHRAQALEAIKVYVKEIIGE